MNTLLPGFNRPLSKARVIDKEMLRLAQQSAKQRKNWDFANTLLKRSYGK